MMPSTYEEKHYKSAHKRFFESIFDKFLNEHFPLIGGPEIRHLFIKKTLELFEEYMPKQERLKPGQMLWVAIDKKTRADSIKVKYKPIILTLVKSEEISSLVQDQIGIHKLLPDIIAKMLQEAFEQDTLLSMRDLGLILKRDGTTISNLRKKYEDDHQTVLPTPASLQDMGSGVTHKVMILRKILIEKKDMNQVRRESCHTQEAIDRYLKDYRRVEMLLDDNKKIEYISRVTTMRPYLINQYEEIYKEVKKHEKVLD